MVKQWQEDHLKSERWLSHQVGDGVDHDAPGELRQLRGI